MDKQMIALVMAVLVFSVPLVHAAEINLVYDANGNLVWDGETYREYNSMNQLSKIYNGSDNSTLLQSFVYHPLEERVLVKTTYNPDSSVKETVYYFSKEFNRVVNASGEFNITYVYLNGNLIAEEVNGVKRFHHNDHLGSSSVLTDSNGDVIERTQYDPLGGIIANGSVTRFNYEAKEYDAVTGDTDFHFRQYQSEYGFFTQPDSLIPNVYDPQSLNRYMFERGNPYFYTDPSGHFGVGLTFSGQFGAIVVGGTSSTTYAVSWTKEKQWQTGSFTTEGTIDYTNGQRGFALADLTANVGLTFLKGNVKDIEGTSSLSGFGAAFLGGLAVDWGGGTFSIGVGPGFAIDIHHYSLVQTILNQKKTSIEADNANSDDDWHYIGSSNPSSGGFKCFAPLKSCLPDGGDNNEPVDDTPSSNHDSDNPFSPDYGCGVFKSCKK